MTLHPHNCNKPTHFIEEYERLFQENKPKRLLEIGVQTGNSLRMWADAFPKSEILGLDIAPNLSLLPPNVQFINGDQTDIKLLQSLGRFDAVIDDGSHMTSHQQISFETLWPQVNGGGVYVIEDLELTRQEEFKDSPLSTVEYFSALLFPVRVFDTLVPAFRTKEIKSVTFADNLLIIRKV